MKKKLILIFVISLFAVLIKTKAMTDEYDEIAKSDKVNVSIFAKKMNKVYSDFKIDFQGNVLSKPYWINTTSPSWSPQIIYEDINKDGKNELIIILTKGYGTGILEREVHVFHIQNQLLNKKLVEVLVDDPIAIVLKNVKTELLPNKANISIGDKKYTIDIKPLGIKPEHIFTDIYFGNIINFEIKDNQLIAKIGGQILPSGGYIGDIQIMYMFRDKMYQVKSIEFKPYK
ncbi:hypothetical protein ACQKOF_03320 [Lysinibacillus sp. NPDC093190]|uniref:hypothetical protein n=1 Tax=Lysinibacillus sp. NPDC093190 TaxID=3390575 RepID=UPI003CFE6B25